MKSFTQLLSSKFNLPVSCYRHCSSRASLILSDFSTQPVGYFVCPSRYVSRIVLYFEGGKADVKLMRDLLAQYSGALGEIKDSDMRLASRHPWDLDVDSNSDPVLQEVYWTQNYKRDENKASNTALFLCSLCNSLFVQPINSTSSICEKCKTSES